MLKRDTTKYELRKGRKTVYVGITNNLPRRKKEHSLDKDFDTMVKIGRTSTRKSARSWESDRIKTYKKTHNGSRPKYNRIG